jgi:hypothetical protein
MSQDNNNKKDATQLIHELKRLYHLTHEIHNIALETSLSVAHHYEAIHELKLGREMTDYQFGELRDNLPSCIAETMLEEAVDEIETELKELDQTVGRTSFEPMFMLVTHWYNNAEAAEEMHSSKTWDHYEVFHSSKAAWEKYFIEKEKELCRSAHVTMILGGTDY